MTEHQGPSHYYWCVLTSLQITLLLEQSSWLNLHLGDFLTWERPLVTLSGISCLGIHLPLALNWSYTLITGTKQNEWLWILFQRPQPVGEAFQSLWGHDNICPLLIQFHVTSITHFELSSLTGLKAWGDAEKFGCCDINNLAAMTSTPYVA